MHASVTHQRKPISAICVICAPYSLHVPHINQEKPALRLTFHILFILILPFILPHHTPASDIFRISVNPWILDSVASARLHPLRPHLPRIQRLSIRLQPVQHIMLLNPMPRRITMVGLNELNHFIISNQPSRLLIHTSYILRNTSAGYSL